MIPSPTKFDVWVEHKKGHIPADIEADILKHKDETDRARSKPELVIYNYTFASGESYFMRTKMDCTIFNSRDYFIYTAGWQNVAHRIYFSFEVTKDLPVKVFGRNNNLSIKDMVKRHDGFELLLLAPNSLIMIDNKKFFLKQRKYFNGRDFDYDCYSLIPKNIFNIFNA
jgi:hypothetical protein